MGPLWLCGLTTDLNQPKDSKVFLIVQIAYNIQDMY